MPETKPYVFIVGSPRSGTTILSEVLDRHPAITQWYEPYFIWDWDIGNLADDVRTPDMLTAESRAFIRKEFDIFRKKSGSQVVIDKSPEHCFKIPFVQAVFPDAKWIHILRDGRDVTLSIKREWDLRREIVQNISLAKFYKEVSTMMRLHHFWRNRLQIIAFEMKNMGSLNPKKYLNKSKWQGVVGWGPRFPGWKEAYDNSSLLRFCAMQWRESVKSVYAGLEQIPKENHVEIRYENFLDNPDEELKRLMDFMEIERKPELDIAHDLKPENKNKWKSKFSKEQLAEIGPELADTLIFTGHAQDKNWF